MSDEQLLEGTCECGEKGTIGEMCDICGGVFSENNASFDDFDDEEIDAYPKDLLKKEGSDDVLPLEAVDQDVADDEY